MTTTLNPRAKKELSRFSRSFFPTKTSGKRQIILDKVYHNSEIGLINRFPIGNIDSSENHINHIEDSIKVGELMEPLLGKMTSITVSAQ